MKSSKTMKLLSFVMLVAMIGIILVSGTYAKYTTEVTGTDTATVAKFSVTSSVNSTSSPFDLFSTSSAYEANATKTEDDVTKGKIAPGTGGKFDITVKNDSEVTVSYKLTLEETANKKRSSN